MILIIIGLILQLPIIYYMHMGINNIEHVIKDKEEFKKFLKYLPKILQKLKLEEDYKNFQQSRLDEILIDGIHIPGPSIDFSDKIS